MNNTEDSSQLKILANMAQSFDSRSIFNDGSFSDVIIKTGSCEIQCHKVVLCAASRYFEALCGPNTKFSERESASIELHEDDPKAIEAILRYIYNFTYIDIQATFVDFTVQSHMSVVVAAKKYLLPKLEAEARKGLFDGIAAIQKRCESTGDATQVLEVIKLLSTHNDHGSNFECTVKGLAQLHIDKLLEIEDFHAYLETEGKQTLGYIMTQATALGMKIFKARGWGYVKPENININACSECQTFWNTDEMDYDSEGSCPRCAQFV